ncbi:hypothetical protein DL546_004408 [Coniochaeta pulveracea]|uniref:CipC-like antibiotic response protein n=1 Tax=Coniochaeta pulveracea TaxID=177199 RepID=A0A420Y0P7_9PEZI|nr:hypothetical protein DL546_004408 [Coniochaeta pulveracea]
MFGFDDAKSARDELYDGQPHESKLSHEFVGGAAAFEAMHLFENQQREKGEAVNHGFAKEMLAAFAGAEVDKLIETKGLDAIDAEKAKRHARQQAEQLYDQQYGDMDMYDPNQRGAHDSLNY